MAFPTIGILGGGQLGRMLVEAGNRLNLKLHVLDAENSPAKQISAHDGHITGTYTDIAALRKLAQGCDILTPEIEHVDTYGLEAVAEEATVEPSWKTIRLIQDKFAQKEYLTRLGVPMAEYYELRGKSVEELEAVGERLGYPLMLKSKTQAFDGRGNYTVRNKGDIGLALEALKGRPLYAEKWVQYRMELAIMVIKTKDGVLSYPTVETVQENSICKLVYAPARNVSDAVNLKAQELARKVVSGFEGKGAFGVEMFLLPDDTLQICEVACRVHNSGHYTIEGCSMSQFEAHLRAIIDLPIPQESIKLRCGSAIMLNILGGSTPDSHLETAKFALSIPNASIHLYSKGDARIGRKMGHVTVTAQSLQQAEAYIQPLIEFVNGTSQSSSLQPVPSRRPIVGVIMGSDSDLKTLVPGLKLLESYFGITPEVEITSAHRTPEYMASYASSAASRGIKVIIAAAGGAAHLPGMAAAHTSLPVIGVPVKGSALDGVDSLYSIVQMPRGVPVATVGINNSVNAALLAARILGAFDADIQRKVEQYAADAAHENRELKGTRLKELGWEKYFQQMTT